MAEDPDHHEDQDGDLLASLGVKMVQQSSVEGKIREVMDAQGQLPDVQRQVRRSQLEIARLKKLVEKGTESDAFLNSRKLVKEEEKQASLIAERDRLQAVIDRGNDMDYMNSGEFLGDENLAAGRVPSSSAASSPVDSGSVSDGPGHRQQHELGNRNSKNHQPSNNMGFGMKAFGDGADEDGSAILARQRQQQGQGYDNMFSSSSRGARGPAGDHDDFHAPAPAAPPPKKRRRIEKKHYSERDLFGEMDDDDQADAPEEAPVANGHGISSAEQIGVRREVVPRQVITSRQQLGWNREDGAKDSFGEFGDNYDYTYQRDFAEGGDGDGHAGGRARANARVKAEEQQHDEVLAQENREQVQVKRERSASGASDVIDLTSGNAQHIWDQMPESLKRREKANNQVRAAAESSHYSAGKTRSRSGSAAANTNSKSSYKYPTAPFAHQVQDPTAPFAAHQVQYPTAPFAAKKQLPPSSPRLLSSRMERSKSGSVESPRLAAKMNKRPSSKKDKVKQEVKVKDEIDMLGGLAEQNGIKVEVEQDQDSPRGQYQHKMKKPTRRNSDFFFEAAEEDYNANGEEVKSESRLFDEEGRDVDDVDVDVESPEEEDDEESAGDHEDDDIIEDVHMNIQPSADAFPLAGNHLKPKSTGGLDMRAVEARLRKQQHREKNKTAREAVQFEHLDLQTQNMILYGETGEMLSTAKQTRASKRQSDEFVDGGGLAKARAERANSGGKWAASGGGKGKHFLQKGAKGGGTKSSTWSTSWNKDKGGRASGSTSNVLEGKGKNNNKATEHNTEDVEKFYTPQSHGKTPHKHTNPAKQNLGVQRKHLKDNDPKKVHVPKEVLKKPAHLRTEGEKELLRDAERARHRAFDDVDDDFYEKNLEEQGNLELEADTNADLENRTTSVVKGKLRVPNYIWDNLYGYQKNCVKWLYSLHEQQVGGILADEMGLGKTIQIVAFLAAMHASNILQETTTRKFGVGPPRTGGILILCPTTLVEQWRDEIKSWYPLFRVSILHAVDLELKREMMRTACKNHGICITSYETFRIYCEEEILEYPWSYLIIDEGHKIRNPDAAVTLAVKKIDTPHRIVLSGTPIQNRLSELWSIFDFIQPGLLGTFPVFQQQFSDVIEQGGQMTATPRMVEGAFQAAQVLREETMPFLLRRTKADVQDIVRLPPKQEQILFVNLTPQQYQVYLDFLATDKVRQAKLKGNETSKKGVPQMFFIMSVLRKLCNHPDLLLKDYPDLKPADYGNVARSGKMLVLGEILKRWKKDGHKVLLFTQTVQMLEILEAWIGGSTDGAENENGCAGLGCQYLRMDGKTPVTQRQHLVSKFNLTPDIFIMIMSTKVGGIGLNITGANRVVLFDPDWNPATDVQARERAWRIGQQREVTVYRLVTAGTLEEKVYHRQIFKHFLSQKILNDPRQKRFMKINDSHDLLCEPPPPPGWEEAKAAGLMAQNGMGEGMGSFKSFFQKHSTRGANGNDGSASEDDKEVVETIRMLGDIGDNPLPEANRLERATDANSEAQNTSEMRPGIRHASRR